MPKKRKSPQPKKSLLWLWKTLVGIGIILLCLTPFIKTGIVLLFGINSVLPVAIVLLIIVATVKVWQEAIEVILIISQWLLGMLFILSWSAASGMLELNLINKPVSYGAGIVGEWWLRITNPISQIFNEAGQLEILIQGTYTIDKAITGNFIAVTFLMAVLFIAVSFAVKLKR